MENVEAQKRKQRWGNDRKRTATTKIKTTKEGKKQFILVWYLAYNLSDLSDPTRNMKVPADLACKINETHKPPYHDNVLTTGEYVTGLYDLSCKYSSMEFLILGVLAEITGLNF